MTCGFANRVVVRPVLRLLFGIIVLLAALLPGTGYADTSAHAIPLIELSRQMKSVNLVQQALILPDAEERFKLGDPSVIAAVHKDGRPMDISPTGRYWLVANVRNGGPSLGYLLSVAQGDIRHLAIQIFDEAGARIDFNETGMLAPHLERWTPSTEILMSTFLPLRREATLVVLVDNLPVPYGMRNQIYLDSMAVGARVRTLREVAIFSSLIIMTIIVIMVFMMSARSRRVLELLFGVFGISVIAFWTLLYQIPQKFFGIPIEAYLPLYLATAAAMLSGGALCLRVMKEWIPPRYRKFNGRTTKSLLFVIIASLPFLPDDVRFFGFALLVICALPLYLLLAFFAWRNANRSMRPFILAWGLLIASVALNGLIMWGLPISPAVGRFIALSVCCLSMLIIACAALINLLQSEMDGRQARLDILIDPLTGVGNRTAFRNCCEMISRRGVLDVVIGFIDVDGLKLVNDIRGHDSGDRLLELVGRELSEALGPRGSLFRIGGDEFVLIAHAPSSEDRQSLIASLNWQCQLVGISVQKSGFPEADLSAGFMPVDDVGSIEAALVQADKRMYDYKNWKRATREENAGNSAL